MAGRILLHIGAPKCGSTYLQRVLLKNQRALRQWGVNYPHLGHGHPGNADQIDHISPRWLTNNLAGFDTLILSHENLFSTAKRGRRLARLSGDQGISLDVIAFLRPFPDWLAADFSQTLKQYLSGASQTELPPPFTRFVEQRLDKIQAHQFLLNWQSVVPDRPITIARHSEIQATMTGQCPALSQIDWALPRWASNPSMPRAQCDQLRSVLAAGHKEDACQIAKTNRAMQPVCTADVALVNATFASQRAALLQDFGVSL